MEHEATALQDYILSDFLAAEFNAMESHISEKRKNDISSFCFTLKQGLQSGGMDQALPMETEKASLLSLSNTPGSSQPSILF